VERVTLNAWARRVGAPADSDLMSVAELAAAHGLELKRFAYLLCGDRQHAEDLVQDVFLALYRRFPDGMPVQHPFSYARRALVNANISRGRNRSSTEVAVDAVPDGVHEDPDHPAARDALWQALRRLPVRQRTVLVLRFYVDASDSDIARILGARRGTVRSLVSRALAALRADPTVHQERE
jgi:RNA polymerase sigma-70 factor (sigma-E family)